MPLHTLPPLLWFIATLAALVTLGVALYGSYKASDSGAPLPLSSLWSALALLACCLVPAVLLAPDPEKARLIAFGVLGGGLASGATALGPVAVLGRGDIRRNFLGRVAVGVLGLVACDRLVGDPVLCSHLIMGVVLGWTAVITPAILAGRMRAGELSAALGAVGAVALAVIWGDRSLPSESLGSAWALGVTAIVLLAAQLATYAPRLWSCWVAGGLAVGLVLPFAWWGAAISATVWWPWLIGVGLAMVTATYLYWAERVEAPGPLVALAPAILAGATLLLANRLFGMNGVCLMALGLLPLILAGGRAVPFGGVLMGAFAGRAALQVFLDRTYLHSYGVDLTHPYAFVGLLAALLVPIAVVGMRHRYHPGATLSAFAAVFAIGLPLGLGYLLHAEPLGTYLVGLLGMAFVLGTRFDRGPEAQEIGAVVTPLLLAAVSWALLAAPWLLRVLNAPRNERIAYFVAGMAMLAAYLFALTRSNRAIPAA